MTWCVKSVSIPSAWQAPVHAQVINVRSTNDGLVCPDQSMKEAGLPCPDGGLPIGPQWVAGRAMMAGHSVA